MVQSECMDVIQERSVSVSFGSSPLAFPPSTLFQHCSTSVHTAFLCMCVLLVVKWTPCAVIHCSTVQMYLLPCTNCALLCPVFCSPWSGLVGSDAPLPHLPSLDTKESVAKMGVILTIAIIPTHNHRHSFWDLIQPKFGWEAGSISTRCKCCHIILSRVWISSWYNVTFIWSLIRKFHSCYVKLAW